MTAVTGSGQGATGKPAPAGRAGSAPGFGLSPGHESGAASPIASGPKPDLRFTALDGLGGLAVPFILAFALRADIARLNAPAAVQHLADGGYVLINLFFVLAGFLLCRPLSAILAGADRDGLFSGLGRRIAPLHLVAWAITFGWLVSGTSPGMMWGWLSSALLLNGVVGPERAGYPMSWSVSVALCSVALLVAVALALNWASNRRRRWPTDPRRSVTGIALTAGLIGTVLLLPSGAGAFGTDGPVAVGQALLGLGAGLLGFRVLEGGTGTLNAPRPGTAPAPTRAPGLGSLLALVALLFCVYRSDLMYELDLLPVFPVAAALVYFLALPQTSGHGPVNRLLDTRPLQWLGSRALALFLLHGPVQLTVQRICELRGLDRASTPVAYGVIGAVVIGSLVAADLGHRLLQRALAPSTPAPVEALSVYRQPRSLPDHVSQIDPEAIPAELRLLSLPRKTRPSKPVSASSPSDATSPSDASSASHGNDASHSSSPTDATDTTAATAVAPVAARVRREAAQRKPVRKLADKLADQSAARSAAKSGAKPAAKPIKLPADEPAAKPTRLPAARSTSKAIKLSTSKPTAKPVKLPADQSVTPPADQSVTLPADQSITLPADQPDQPAKLPTDRQIELTPGQPAKLPTDQPITLPADDSIKLPADKPTRKPASRKPATKSADQPIDLDDPNATADSTRTTGTDAQS